MAALCVTRDSSDKHGGGREQGGRSQAASGADPAEDGERRLGALTGEQGLLLETLPSRQRRGHSPRAEAWRKPW